MAEKNVIVSEGLTLYDGDFEIIGGDGAPVAVSPDGSVYVDKLNGVPWIRQGGAWKKIAEANVENGSANNTGGVSATVDQLAVADHSMAKWTLWVKETGQPNYRVSEVTAIWDGTTADYNEIVHRFGSKIAGLRVSVDIASGNVRLLVTATNNFDVRAVRYPMGVNP